MSERIIMPVSVVGFLEETQHAQDLPDLTLAEALAESGPFQEAVKRFDDVPAEGVDLAMYDVIDAAGKRGGAAVFNVGKYGKPWAVAMQAVLWTRYQERKQSPTVLL